MRARWCGAILAAARYRIDVDSGGQIMVRYWYAFTPIVIAGTILVLALPWLGLIAVLVAAFVVLVALAALLWAIGAVAVSISHTVGRHLHGRRRMRSRAAPALRAPARPYAYAAARSNSYRASQLWSPTDITASGRDGSPDESKLGEGRIS
jgi:hypothetical protein